MLKSQRLSASLLALLCACGNDNGGESSGQPDGSVAAEGGGGCAVEVSFTSLHAELFSTTRCAIAGCHAETSSQGNLNFQAGKAAVHDMLINGGTFNAMARGAFPNRVVPGNPEMSYLYEKVSKTNPAGGGTGRMPPGLPLADCEIQAIRDWIMAGAPND